MIHKIIAILFIVFAAVQYNDQDFLIWIPIYLIVAMVALAMDKGWRNKIVILGLCVFYFLGMCIYIPDVVYWFRDGMPSIGASMKAESPFIEFVREFFGLGICLAVLTIYLRVHNGEER